MEQEDTKTIHVARLSYTSPINSDTTEHIFASIDGDRFVELKECPEGTAAEYQVLTELMAQGVTLTGTTRARISFAREYLLGLGARFDAMEARP